MKVRDIEKLVKILEDSILTEIEITDFWGRRVKISKSSNNSSTPPTTGAGMPVVHKIEEDKDEEVEKKLAVIKSPIVGTFYRASTPDAPSYVEVGDIVKPGQVVCIVEAMKLMNEIESDVAGRIVKILVKNEEPVEYNQKLFLVEHL